MFVYISIAQTIKISPPIGLLEVILRNEKTIKLRPFVNFPYHNNAMQTKSSNQIYRIFLSDSQL